MRMKTDLVMQIRKIRVDVTRLTDHNKHNKDNASLVNTAKCIVNRPGITSVNPLVIWDHKSDPMLPLTQ